MKAFLRRYGALLLCLVLAVVLVVGGRHTNRQIQDLNRRIDHFGQYFQETEEEISLAETKGLLRGHWVSCDKIDWKNKTLSLVLRVVPWDYTLDTRVSVVCNGETIPLRQHGTYFRMELDAPLDKSCTVTRVIVAQEGQERQAEVGWELMDHRELAPGFIFGGFNLERLNNGTDGRDILLSGTGTILLPLEDMISFAAGPDNNTEVLQLTNGEKEEGTSIQAGTFIKLVDGEAVEETPIQWEPVEDGFQYRGEPELTVTQTQGQDTEFVVSMTNQQGINYRYTFLHYSCKFPGEYIYDAYEGDLYTKVYAPNGDLLFTVLGEGSLPRVESKTPYS